jgi:hypothetical protein
MTTSIVTANGAFIAIEIVENLLEMLLGAIWTHEDTRGCLHDLCAFKPDISFKLRTGDICPTCADVLRERLEPTQYAAIVAMLEEIRSVAVGRSHTVRHARAATLAQKVDEHFPFPVAYCFRSMRAELAYSRKWQRLLELYAVSIRYLTFTLLADPALRTRYAATPNSYPISRLRQPTGGTWHSACFALLRVAHSHPETPFLERYVTTIDELSISDAHAVSERLTG